MSREYSGTIILERIYPGSKSERVAVKLDTGDQKFLLRRPGVRSYRDEELEGLVGKKVRCHGVKRGIRLYLQDVEQE